MAQKRDQSAKRLGQPAEFLGHLAQRGQISKSLLAQETRHLPDEPRAAMSSRLSSASGFWRSSSSRAWRLSACWGPSSYSWPPYIKPCEAKPSKQSHAKPCKAKQSQASQAKPSKAKAKPSKAKQSQAKPSKAKQRQAKTSKAKQSQAKPSKAKQSQAKQSQDEHCDVLGCKKDTRAASDQ